MGWISERPRARRALVIAGGVLAGLLATAFVLAGFDRASSDDPAAERTGTVTERASPVEPTATSSASATSTPAVESEREPLPPLPDTDDPDEYTAAVAKVVFGMNYRRHDPAAYEDLFRAALWPEIAPDAQDAIMAAISRRIPTPDMWAQMHTVRQTSKFTVDLVWEPRSGRDFRETGGGPEGVVLRTVSGTQTETWRGENDDTHTTRRPTAVTVTVVCAPAASPCRLIGIQPNVEP